MTAGNEVGSKAEKAVHMDISENDLKFGINVVKIEPLENIPLCKEENIDVNLPMKDEENSDVNASVKDEGPILADYCSSNLSANTSGNVSTNGVTASQPGAVTRRQARLSQLPIEVLQGLSGKPNSAQKQNCAGEDQMPPQIIQMFPNVMNLTNTIMWPVKVVPSYTMILKKVDLADRPGVTDEQIGTSPNSIRSLLQIPFERRTLVQKLQVKELGPDRPDLEIKQQASTNGKTYTRGFSCNWYNRKAWLAGCSHVNAVFCFPCLLFKTPGTDTTWTLSGVRDMKHLSERIKKHECTRAHIENTIKLAMLGRVNIATQLDEGHRTRVRKHNKDVDKNRHILSKVIDQFCGAFELALHDHNETDTSDHPVVKGLEDLVALLDSVLEEDLNTATVFRGTLKTVQNELLDCMRSVLKDYILEEVKNADYLAIQVDETSDISTRCQLMLVLRYIDSRNNVQERFFEFIPLQNASSDTIATSLLERLSNIVPEGQESRLISQAYDGAAVMRGATGGVQCKVKDVYRCAHYVHCYAHQLNLIMQQATSHIPRISSFFSDLGGFAGFFSQSSTRTPVLDEVAAHRLPGTSTRRWNFHSRAVNTVYEHKDDLLWCFQTIRDSGNFDPPTVREAGGFVRMLEDKDFHFFLALFYKIMPHVDTLFDQLQKRNIDSVYITENIQRFTDSMQTIRDSIPSLHLECSGSVKEPPTKRLRTLGQEEQQLATEACETILSHTKERFSFTNHLVSATLLQGDLFPKHTEKFPDSALETTVKAYPVLNMAKLKMELSLIYENTEFRSCSGALTLFQFFMENNLQGTFTETVSLLKILITTPMTTPESERCFSTLTRIKTFLRNAMTHDRLNALAMLSMEKDLIRSIPGFNSRVIERFASQNDRREQFLYK